MKTFEQTSWRTEGTFPGLYNHLGYVATSYRRVQNIDALKRARESAPLPQPGYASAVKAVFQGAEVALMNMSALLMRSAALLKRGDVSEAAELLLVFAGFNSSITQLSRIPGELGGCCGDFDEESLVLRITDSANYSPFLKSKKEFDAALLRYFGMGQSNEHAAGSRLASIMKHEGLGDTACRIQQLSAQADHDMRVWYNNLLHVEVPAQAPDYATFVGAEHITEAIRQPHYGPETLMNPFRSFHITPEIFAAEINEHLRFATDKIALAGSRDDDQPLLQEAFEHLSCANTLFPCIQKCFDALAEGLSYAQYHKFRGNFGATSASESKAIAKDLLKMLPGSLGCAVVESLTGIATNPRHPKATHEVSTALIGQALRGRNRWLWRMITAECVKIHIAVMAWYDGHFKLPMLHVGASSSLAGAKDAIQHNLNLQNRVREHNALNPLVAARHLPVSLNKEEDGVESLAAYINSEGSFFSLRADTIGAVNRSMLTHLCDGNPDFERLKALQKECREGEKGEDADEDARYAARSAYYLRKHEEGIFQMSSDAAFYDKRRCCA